MKYFFKITSNIVRTRYCTTELRLSPPNGYICNKAKGGGCAYKTEVIDYLIENGEYESKTLLFTLLTEEEWLLEQVK